MDLIRNILVSHDVRNNCYKVNFECLEDTGHNVNWVSGGTLLLVSILEDRLVAVNSKTKKPMFVWKDREEMVEQLCMNYECAVKLL
jgi:hypothetical protein